MFSPARITVGTAATRLTAPGPGSLDGFALAVQAPTDTVIYLGGSDVTTANGWPLPAGSREAYDLEVGNAGRKVETWREERDRLIVQAHHEGGTLREIADLVGLSNPGVLNIIRKAPVPEGIWGKQDDTPDHRFKPQRDS